LSTEEYSLLDIVVYNAQTLKVSIIYKNNKTHKAHISKPSDSTTIPYLPNAPKSWLIPIISTTSDNNDEIDIIEVKFEEKLNKRLTTNIFSSRQHTVTTSILNPKSLSILDEFTTHQTEFKLSKDDRETAIKEVVKKAMNYNLHFPWTMVAITANNENNTFTVQKKDTPAAPPNTPAPPESSETEHNFLFDQILSSNSTSSNSPNSPASPNPTKINDNPTDDTNSVSTIRPSSPLSQCDISMTIDQPIEEGSFTRFDKEIQLELAHECQIATNINLSQVPHLQSSSNTSHNLITTNHKFHDPMDTTIDWFETSESTHTQNIITNKSVP
jgi:hypothetical protein